MPRNKQFDEQEVLTKAVNLFWKQGYSATSVQDLVTKLGINRASLYTSFGDKEKLFKRAFKQYIETNDIGMRQFFEAQTNVKVGFQNLFQLGIDEACLDPDKKGCFVVNTTTELVPGDPSILEIVKTNKSNIESIFFDFLQTGEDENQYAKGKDLTSLATMLYTLFSGIKVVSKVETDKKALTQMVRVTLALLD